MLLEVDDVDVFYGDSQVLHGASLAVAEGEQAGIVGRNGMGKTTLLHTIMGMMRPRRGGIAFRGQPIGGSAPEAIARAGITLVPQGRRVFKSLTVGENLRVSECPGGEGSWTVDDVCSRLPLLADRWNQTAGSLSGGQQQMLALGRAIVGNGSLLLLDEPSEGLDQHHLALLVDVVREMRDGGTAVLLVEQKLRFAMDLVDTVHVMVRGQLTSTVTADEFRASPDAILRDLGFGKAATAVDLER
jgi:branched-chain amino acid transport system ATP-binding protein